MTAEEASKPSAPAPEELVADLYKVIEWQSREIANLRESNKKLGSSDEADKGANEGANEGEKDEPVVAVSAAEDGKQQDAPESKEAPAAADEYFTHGLQALTAAADATLKASQTGAPAPSAASTEQTDSSAPRAADERTSKKRPADEVQRHCLSCGTTQTPKWRCAMTLCNACGLRNAKRWNGTRALAGQAMQEMHAAAMQQMMPLGGVAMVPAMQMQGGPHRMNPYGAEYAQAGLYDMQRAQMRRAFGPGDIPAHLKARTMMAEGTQPGTMHRLQQMPQMRGAYPQGAQMPPFVPPSLGSLESAYNMEPFAQAGGRPPWAMLNAGASLTAGAHLTSAHLNAGASLEGGALINPSAQLTTAAAANASAQQQHAAQQQQHAAAPSPATASASDVGMPRMPFNIEQQYHPGEGNPYAPLAEPYLGVNRAHQTVW